MGQKIFCIEVWNVKIHQALAPIDIIQSLLTNDDIVKFLKPRLKGLSYLSRPIPNVDLGHEYLKGEVDIAFKVYMNQMIILAITYAELMIKDFYRCLFNAHPERMNTVLSPDGKGKATVDLNEILRQSSKKSILNSLAERAANKISSRKIDEIVEKLIKDSKLVLSMPIGNDLKLLNEQRNRIVHEGALEDITLSQVHAAYGQILYLLYFLGEMAIKYDVPFLDNMGFIDEFRKKTADSKSSSLNTV